MMNRQIAVRKLEAARKQYMEWLRTGKNPPPGFGHVTERQREALYKQTLIYQACLEAHQDVETSREQIRFRIQRLIVN